jgi:Core-2/I-Branching enzyme
VKDVKLRKPEDFHAFLVLAHKDPELVTLLVNTIQSFGKVYLHVDRKPLHDFTDLLSRKDIFVTSQINVKWASWTQVEAQLILVNQAIKEGAKRLTLISGDSLPIALNHRFENLLRSNLDICHNRALKFSKNPEMDDQYFRRYFSAKNHRGFLPRLLNYFSRKWPIKIDISRHLGYLDLYIGSAWWSITSETMRKVLDYQNQNPKILDFFKKAKLPDELYFQTLVSNTSENLNGTGIMYANWRDGNTPHPGDLDTRQIQEEFRSQKFYFARKFSTSDLENLKVWRELYTK